MMSAPESRARVRSCTAEKPFLEAFAPAGPLFGRTVGVESFRLFRMRILGLVRKDLLCGVPALPVDAAQSKGAAIHLVLISRSSSGERRNAEMKHGDWP